MLQHDVVTDEMSQEKNCAEIENNCYTDSDLKLDDYNSAIKIVVSLNQSFMADKYLVQYDKICDSMHASHEEEQNDESKEGDVVLGANAGIQPSTVVIESVHTAIANTTVFGRVHD